MSMVQEYTMQATNGGDPCIKIVFFVDFIVELLIFVAVFKLLQHIHLIFNITQINLNCSLLFLLKVHLRVNTNVFKHELTIY